jgi:hypothetical protein
MGQFTRVRLGGVRLAPWVGLAVAGCVLAGGAAAGAQEPTTTTGAPACLAPGDAACGWRLSETDVQRTVEVGQAPVALEVLAGSPSGEWFPFPSAAWRVVDGALPPGLTLLDDGTFDGAAARAGTWHATIEACRPGAEPAVCASTALTVTVLPPSIVPSGGTVAGATITAVGAAPQLPRTGAALTPLALAGVGALGAGLGLASRGRRAR